MSTFVHLRWVGGLSNVHVDISSTFNSQKNSHFKQCFTTSLGNLAKKLYLPLLSPIFYELKQLDNYMLQMGVVIF